MVAINKLYPEVIKVCRLLIVEDEVLKILVKKFSESLTKSLNSQYSQDSIVKCKLTYVTDFPDGREKGSCIGLEFSGKIFRLVYVGLKGDRSCITLSRLYEFPNQKLHENLSKVVDYVAKCINNFMETYDIQENKPILGVTTYFPIEQESLQEGKILQWGKDFQCNDLSNRDFFYQLKLSLRKYKYTKGLYLISLVNNSTACLLSGLYKDPGTRIGLHLGDDTNVTYIEKFENMTAFTGDGLRTRTAVGVEMKNFGDDGSLDFIRTDFDFQIDAASTNPGVFVLDKMVSGAYLGEIARLCLYKLASMGIILDGYVSPALSMGDGLKTVDLAMMEMDPENKFTRCRAVMYNLGYKVVTDEDCMQIRFVCRCVAKRSAYLVAACLTAMIHRMPSRYVHIMSDGYLLKEFPNYENYLTKKINKLKKPAFKFLLLRGDKDEVAIGAGLIAYIYKDGIIKLEDKLKVLPPFNINKYNMTELPASCIDCECEPLKLKKRSLSTVKTEVIKPAEVNKGVFETAEPVLATPSSLLQEQWKPTSAHFQF